MEEGKEKNKREEIKGLRQHIKLPQCFNVGRFFQCLATCFLASQENSVNKNMPTIHTKVYAVNSARSWQVQVMSRKQSTSTRTHPSPFLAPLVNSVLSGVVSFWLSFSTSVGGKSQYFG